MTADSDTSIRFHKLHISVINQIYNKYVFIERLQFYFFRVQMASRAISVHIKSRTLVFTHFTNAHSTADFLHDSSTHVMLFGYACTVALFSPRLRKLTNFNIYLFFSRAHINYERAPYAYAIDFNGIILLFTTGVVFHDEHHQRLIGNTNKVTAASDLNYQRKMFRWQYSGF